MIVKDISEMKTFGEIICLCGILIFKLMLCSADDKSGDTELTKLYKFSDAKEDTIDAKAYKIIKGETVEEPTKKVWMKVEPDSKKGLLHKLSISKKKADYISREIEVFKNLKKGKKDLLSECVVDMLNNGTYEEKKALIIPGLGKNLKEYTSKPYSWDKLSKIGPCMIKALRLLHNHDYVHQNLKPEIFAFGTEEKVAPLKKNVYLFDVGLAEKYTDSKGKHKKTEEISEFVGEMAFASRAAMKNMTQCRRDDIESLFFVMTYLAGLTSPFSKKDLYADKTRFIIEPVFRDSLFEKYKITDIRVLNAFLDFAHDVEELFTAGTMGSDGDFRIEPEYDDFISCFDQGLSEKGIKDKYQFVAMDKFNQRSLASFIGHGNTTKDPNNKMEVVMKLMRANGVKKSDLDTALSYKMEVRVYKGLKKGLNHSLLRENVCDMLDYGLYDDRRAIIMPRLGLDLFETIASDFLDGYPYELLCIAARRMISALRFIHSKGYIHRDLKLENFAFGSVEVNKSDKSQADKPLATRLYLIDFGCAIKWAYPNGKHKPRIFHNHPIGTTAYNSRAALKRYSQSRRDEMESVMYAMAVAATGDLLFRGDDRLAMCKQRNEFISKPARTKRTFEKKGIADERIHKAFIDYAAELNKLFVSDEPEYFEKEPDYNAFCVCFGGKPGNNSCAVE